MAQQLVTETLDKGGLLEEQLRCYFLSLGYYVVRGAKLKIQDVDATDVDLWLYLYSSAISRERINVDVKNKAKPAAVERVIVARGIMDILGCDRCIVATTDPRDEVIRFGAKHGVTVLGGSFLQQIKAIVVDRISEETFLKQLRDDLYKFTTNWFALIEASKSRLLEPPSFAAANEALQDVGQLLGQPYAHADKQESFIRVLYLFISHLYVLMDALQATMAFLEPSHQRKDWEEGLRYGVTGEENIKTRLQTIARATGRSIDSVRQATAVFPADILRDFILREGQGQQLFARAKDFEKLAYQSQLVKPSALSPESRGVLGMLCDIFRVDRKHVLAL